MRPDILTFSCPRQQGVAVAGGSSSILGSDFPGSGHVDAARQASPQVPGQARLVLQIDPSAMHARLRQDTGASV